MQKFKNKSTIKISLRSKLAHLNPMREGDASQGPLENMSQDRLIGDDFLNLTCEGLLLEIQAGGLACRWPPSAITLAELRRSHGDASRRPTKCYLAISFACADLLTYLHRVI
jgi:hypothetical protein